MQITPAVFLRISYASYFFSNDGGKIRILHGQFPSFAQHLWWNDGKILTLPGNHSVLFFMLSTTTNVGHFCYQEEKNTEKESRNRPDKETIPKITIIHEMDDDTQRTTNGDGGTDARC